MARIINASIDLMKIDRSKIKETDKGQKFYNITIFVNDEFNKYGQDVSIATSITKEEREAGGKPVYIGNGKTVKNTDNQTPNAAPAGGTNNSNDNDLPF